MTIYGQSGVAEKKHLIQPDIFLPRWVRPGLLCSACGDQDWHSEFKIDTILFLLNCETIV